MQTRARRTSGITSSSTASPGTPPTGAQAETDWQAQRLNDPLIAFEAPKHAGALGREFSLLKVSNPRIRVLALKKAEQSDEIIVRLVELDGKPQPDVRSLVRRADHRRARSQRAGAAGRNGDRERRRSGHFVLRVSAAHVRRSAGCAPAKVAAVRSVPVALHYDLATASNDGTQSRSGFDGKGNALPAEMLPAQITFNDVQFQLAPAKTGAPNAVVAKGQTIDLPAGHHNRVYVLAASADGDQKATFKVGNQKSNLNIQDWGGFIGQWDDRQWSSNDTSARRLRRHDRPQAGLHQARRSGVVLLASSQRRGRECPLRYSYLFAYPIDLPAGAKPSACRITTRSAFWPSRWPMRIRK